MKKPLTLLLISYAALIFIISGIVAFNMSCEKQETVIIPATEEDSALYYADIYDHLEEPIDTTLFDSKINAKSISRSGDGFWDIAILATNYKGQGGLIWFLFDRDKSRAAIIRWLNTFEPQFRPDTNKIRIHYRNCKGNFSCSGGGFFEGVSCNFNKIQSEVEDMEQDENFTHDLIGVLGNEMGGGGGGNGYFFLGVANHSDCRFDGIIPHEIIHEYYFPHVDTCYNKAAGVYTTNGGCELVNAPTLLYHQELIFNDYITAIE